MLGTQLATQNDKVTRMDIAQRVGSRAAADAIRSLQQQLQRKTEALEELHSAHEELKSDTERYLNEKVGLPVVSLVKPPGLTCRLSTRY
eukprot:scaffold244_cov416-Prasinococcus_capsulatus_cf.AAC.14